MTDHIRDEDLAELATGAVVGAERALALQHVVSCGTCLHELSQLSRASDELLSLAPDTEPPAGFESAVIATMTGGERTRPAKPGTRKRFLLGLAAAVLAAAVGAAAVWQSTADDRRATHDQEQTLSVGRGTQLSAFPITTASGSPAGTMFLYAGDPSWLVVSVAGAPADGAYAMTVHNRDGRSYRAGACQVDQGIGMDSYRLRHPAADVASVELTGPGGVRLSVRT